MRGGGLGCIVTLRRRSPVGMDFILSIGQGEEAYLGHWEMLPVVGEELRLIGNGDGGNGHVGVGKRMPFSPPVPAQETGLLSDFRCHREALQGVQKTSGSRFLASAESGVHLRDVYRAAGEDMPLVDELVKEFGTAISSVEVIEYNGRIEEKGRHQRPWFRRRASSKRSSGSDRICST